MLVEPLPIAGAYLFTPVQHADDRGVFLEWYRADVLQAATGRSLPLAQANNSISRRGVVRGIHYADVPPGQAKFVYCPHGAVLDVVVDVRVGSPTFGTWTSVRLDDVERRAVYLAEGLGHGFEALTDSASITYLCSTPYAPGHEHSVQALDPALGIGWTTAAPILAPRDEAAPTLAEAEAAGVLPRWSDCLGWYDETGQTVAR
ncbi:MAG: dTDP-4-dehydrorhamnose 3,5-epimerase family protein [Actinobacteria bacterium]|nr:dTDP-4-dehydrorhamnose 3,5-epimerase family protein [Actinomycetota bacterium]